MNCESSLTETGNMQAVISIVTKNKMKKNEISDYT